MLPAKKPTKKDAAFAKGVRRKIMGGKTVKRADILRAIDIESAGIQVARAAECRRSRRAAVGTLISRTSGDPDFHAHLGEGKGCRR